MFQRQTSSVVLLDVWSQIHSDEVDKVRKCISCHRFGDGSIPLYKSSLFLEYDCLSGKGRGGSSRKLRGGGNTGEGWYGIHPRKKGVPGLSPGKFLKIVINLQ